MTQKKDVRDRFFSKVQIPADKNQCWIWAASLDTFGYGLFRIDRKLMKAHRMSFLLHNGYLTDGLIVRHSCDNTRCVNPLHLLEGTPADNAHDRDKRGRFVKNLGEAHGCSKLTSNQVSEIRYLRNNLKLKLKEVADMYNVDFSTVCDISKYKTWRHL